MTSARRRIAVVSHHRSGGGTPLDSLWFSAPLMRPHGVELSFHWAASPRCLAAALTHRRVLFDGIHSLAHPWSQRLQTLLAARRIPAALYWHETEHLLAAVRTTHWFRRAMERGNLFHFHVCTAGLAMLARDLAVPPERMALLPNCAPSAEGLQPGGHTPPPPLVVGCGAAGHRKGTDLFLQVAAKVAARVPEARFEWIGGFGDGDFGVAALEDWSSKHGLAGRVGFPGHVPGAVARMAGARVFLLSSRDDPMPKVLMENLALGNDIVAFDVGGVRELLGPHGTVVPRGDCAAAADAVAACLLRPATQQERLARHQYYTARFTAAAFADRFPAALRSWENLIPSPPPRGPSAPASGPR